MKIIRFISRIIVGVVFIFSGFVKVIDPLGSAYKFSDYFSAFRLDFLKELALPLAIVLSVFELVLGLVLILGFKRKIAYWLLLAFMSFFTILTFILAIFNPVSDCGCFGDAIIMTNWQTFYKNIILMVFVLILFWSRNTKYLGSGDLFEWSTILIVFAAVFIFSFWNYRHLPVIDFRPFDLGTIIANEMIIPVDAPLDQYETELFYRNKETGKTERFTLQDYPRDTVNWEFVDSESRLVKKGYEPPIHDFAIIDPYDTEVTDELLDDPGYSLLMISYDIEKANPHALQFGNVWSGLESIAGDFKFYPITASTQRQINEVKRDISLEYNFCSADEILLKTIVRSNPGFVLLKNGTIIGKWGWRDFPSLMEFDTGWPEMIRNATESIDEEQLMLMEEGIYDEMNFNVIQFDKSAVSLTFNLVEQRNARGATTTFILSVLLVISVLQILVIIRRKYK